MAFPGRGYIGLLQTRREVDTPPSFPRRSGGLRDRADIWRAPILCASRVSEARFFMSFYTDSELSRSYNRLMRNRSPFIAFGANKAIDTRSKGMLYDRRRWFNIFRNYVKEIEYSSGYIGRYRVEVKHDYDIYIMHYAKLRFHFACAFKMQRGGRKS